MNAHHLAAFNLIAILLVMIGCASNPSNSSNSDRIGFEQARAMFASRGVQPGQPLPPLSLVDLDGNPIELSAVQAGRPMALVTASLTCNVARRQQNDVDSLRKRLGDAAAVIVIYTIDAHPKGDPCPYTGKEWVPKDNEKDAVLVKQPTTLAERLALARQYQARFSSGGVRGGGGDGGEDGSEGGGGGSVVLVDTMDNASWYALGQAPNLGLFIDKHGIVRLRQGWFDPKQMAEALDDPRSG